MQVDSTVSNLLFAMLAVMVAVWFLLITKLYKSLESRHPEKYIAMGRPSLFLRNSISGGLATLKFLIAREHKALGDRSLSKLSDSMLIFLAVYLLLMVALSVFDGSTASPMQP